MNKKLKTRKVTYFKNNKQPITLLRACQLALGAVMLILTAGWHPAYAAPRVYLTTFNDTLAIADPTIFVSRGSYYLIGTSGDKTVGAGFKLYSSKDLKTWHRVVKPGHPDYLALDSSHSFGNKGFWAPQILKTATKGPGLPYFLIAYTANEQIAIARAGQITGPFTQADVKDHTSGFAPLFKDGFKHIDPFIFTDPASKKTYIYYVKLDHGNNIYVSELQQTRKLKSGQAAPNYPYSIVPGTETPCIKATESWENTAGADWPVTEGPTVVYHDGFYYLFYSANDFRNPDYAVGYAVSSSPTGPWTKAAVSPVISRKNTGLAGCGHGDVFQDTKGQFYYVFHAHNSAQKVAPRKTYLIAFRFVPATVKNKARTALDANAKVPALIQMDYKSVRPLLKANH